MNPVAVFEFCPKCRSKSIILHDEKAIRCTDCGFVIYLNAAAAVAVIIIQKGKIVFMRRAHDPGKGLLDLPGGFAEYGESLEEAAIREVSEELGIALRDLHYFGSQANQYNYKGITYHTCDAVFIASIADHQLLHGNEESLAIELIAPENIKPDEIAFVSLRQMVKKYCQQTRK